MHGNPIAWPFFPANKEASLAVWRCQGAEYAFEQTARERHVRHHEWTAHGDIMTVTGSKMLTWALGIKWDTCATLNFINNPWCDIWWIFLERLWNYLKHFEILLRHFRYYFLITWVRSSLKSEYFLIFREEQNPWGPLEKRAPSCCFLTQQSA